MKSRENNESGARRHPLRPIPLREVFLYFIVAAIVLGVLLCMNGAAGSIANSFSRMMGF